MRSTARAIAMLICLGPVAVLGAAGNVVGQSDSVAPPAPADAAGSSADAAARHAKRTACLKQAKTKKLVGAAKTAFIKNCVAAP